MSEDSNLQGVQVGSSILITAGVVIVLSGAKLASGILVPFLLSLFLTIIMLVPVEALIKRGILPWLSLLIVISAMLMFFAGVSIILGTTVKSFAADLPTYQEDFKVLMSGIAAWFGARGIDVNGSGLLGALDPGKIISFFKVFLGDIGGVLSNILLITFTVIFLLADAGLMRQKFAWHRRKHSAVDDQLGSVSNLFVLLSTYTKIKAAVSLLTGVVIWLGLTLMGVKYPVLWGLLAFLLNFIPTVGSIIAAFPVVLLALLNFDPVLVLMIITLYIVVNVVVGNFIEPIWMGGEVGLSTLFVFLSMVFWGWLFGPVGMLLSVPLTISVKFLALRNPSTLWLSVLLSNRVEKITAEVTSSAAD